MKHSDTSKTPIVSTLMSLRGMRASHGTQQLRDAILRSGSATEDNIQCAESLEFGHGERPEVGQRVGVRLRDSPYFVSQVADAIDNIEFPSEVRDFLPELTEEAWSAATRLMTLILLELEKNPNQG